MGVIEFILSSLDQILDGIVLFFRSIVSLFQILLVGVPTTLEVVNAMPGFMVTGCTITIIVCLVLVLLKRRSS